MENKQTFSDPLDDIDPIMEKAYSSADYESENSSSGDASKVNISDVEFPEISTSFNGASVETGLFSNIPVQVSVELGRSTISLREIFELTEGSIVELDRLVGEPLDLVVNGQIVARGEVVAIDNNFGLRVKTINSQSKS
ncbi:flagellar motor switch protein FliN [Candidatus Marinamargulisbacteria bacterium SCGC AG-343-D04]|nr:flagellar motor switch protein FliN [Candidatus Marinamargulisbacteria bacterium SCGC AG-343-D04]